MSYLDIKRKLINLEALDNPSRATKQTHMLTHTHSCRWHTHSLDTCVHTHTHATCTCSYMLTLPTHIRTSSHAPTNSYTTDTSPPTYLCLHNCTCPHGHTLMHAHTHSSASQMPGCGSPVYPRPHSQSPGEQLGNLASYQTPSPPP